MFFKCIKNTAFFIFVRLYAFCAFLCMWNLSVKKFKTALMTSFTILLKTFRKIFRIVFRENMSPQNEINLWFLLGSKFIFFGSQVSFISSFIERFNAKGCLGVDSLPPTHKFVAKFWLIAINTVFQVYFLKASWNWFIKSPCTYTDWTFAFFFCQYLFFPGVSWAGVGFKICWYGQCFPR